MTAIHPVEDLLAYIDASPSPWHTVASTTARLEQAGFRRLSENQRWELQSGDRGYVIRDDSSIIALKIGQRPLTETGIKILGAHTDSPGLRVKPQPSLYSDGLWRIALDVYGGPILASFTDRDLSLAGRLAFRDTDGSIKSRLLRFNRPLLRLPNLAIHMNRTVNEDGLKLQKQTELAAILQSAEQQLNHQDFIALLAQESGLTAVQIMSWELAVYDTQPGSLWGVDNRFFSNSQLDNLASCHAGLSAFLDPQTLDSDNTLVCALFDHEEIGSESCKGAGGSFLGDVLQRLIARQVTDTEDYARVLARSFMVSADMAHAYHPNYPNAYEGNHKVLINQGPVIKINANHRYATQCLSEAQFMAYCQQAGVAFQKYAHRGDLACGSTIGPISSAKLGIATVDVGNPMWSMHSLRETAGVEDHVSLIAALKVFFSAPALNLD